MKPLLVQRIFVPEPLYLMPGWHYTLLILYPLIKKCVLSAMFKKKKKITHIQSDMCQSRVTYEGRRKFRFGQFHSSLLTDDAIFTTNYASPTSCGQNLTKTEQTFTSKLAHVSSHRFWLYTGHLVHFTH